MDTEENKKPLEERLGANHQTRACDSGKMKRTLGMGRNMLGAVRRGRYIGAGLPDVVLVGWAGVELRMV